MPDDLFSSDDIQSASEPATPAPAEDSGPSPEVQEGSLETAAPGAIPQVEGTPSAQPAPKPQGPIPFDRHKAVLENARKEYEQRYAWAQGIEPEQGYQLASLAKALAQDPVATYRAIGAQLEAAGLLKGANGHPQPPSDPRGGKPQPNLITEDGRKVYSAEQAEALTDWAMQQVEQRLGQRFGPIEQQFQMSQVMQEANTTASQVLQEASQWPHFNECAVDIRDEMIRDKRLSLEGAYRRVVVPKLRQLERASVLKELKQKPSATTMNPGRRPTTAESPADTPWEDLLARTWDTMVGT